MLCSTSLIREGSQKGTLALEPKIGSSHTSSVVIFPLFMVEDYVSIKPTKSDCGKENEVPLHY